MFKFKFLKSKDEELDKSELVPYFRKEEIDIFFNHPDFRKKYREHTPTINAFIHEVRKNKKAIETIDIINKYIINLETPQMLKIIYLYLDNTDEERTDFFTIIDKTYEIGNYSVPVEDKIAIDQRYNSLRIDGQTFNDILLDELFTTLDYTQKNYLNDLLSVEGGLDALKQLFNDRYKGNFNMLLRLLNNRSVDYKILNKDVTDNLDEDQFRELVFTLLNNENTEIAKYVKVLVSNNRFDLIKDMLEYNLVSDIININVNKQELSDETLIQSIEDLKQKQLTTNYV